MFCPKCKLASADNARFCGHCGEPFAAAPPPAAAAAPAGAGASAGASASAATADWTAGPRPLPGVIERIKNILLTPKTEWVAIEAEPTTIAQLYAGYAMPLMGLSALMTFLHFSVIGVSLPFGGSYRTPFFSGLTTLIVSFGFALLGLFLVGSIINALAPTFAGTRDQRQALKTAAYACTPAWIGSVLSLLGGFGTFLQFLAALYGIYLLHAGLPVLMRSSRERATGYTVSVVVCTLLLGVAFGLLLNATRGFGVYGGYGALSGAAMTQAERQQRAAAEVGSIIGGALGTDQKGKENLSAAINNLAEAGKHMDQQGAAADANAVAATAGLLTAIGGAMGGSRHVDPVDFHALESLLPASLPGMQRSDAQGSTQQALGVKGSSASADYSDQSGARSTIKISDMSGVAGLLDLATSMAANTSSESDSAFERNATVAGRTVHEKFDKAGKHGEITAIVDKRFVVEVSGDGLDMSALEQNLAAVDFGRLDALKDAGAQPNP